MIVENQYLKDIQKIWKENNSGYINYESNQKAITDENMTQIVYREDNVTMAYAIVYEGNDFLEKEGFVNKIKDMPKNVIYIWEIVTDKNYTGKGIANKLIKYILEKYKNYTIYSCINKLNIASLKLHEKNGFKILYEFEQKEESKISHNYIMIKNN